VFTTVLALIDWVAVFVDPVPSVSIDLEQYVGGAAHAVPSR
jgi:hypothetical protein